MTTTFASIIGLVFICSPAAVGFAVRPVIVNTLKSQTRRALAHIGEKHREVIPALADSDTAPAVTRIRRAFRVLHTLSHAHPNVVGRASGQSVFTRAFTSRSSAPHTSAAKRHTVNVGARHLLYGAALTLAQIIEMVPAVSRALKYGPHKPRPSTGYGTLAHTGYGTQ